MIPRLFQHGRRFGLMLGGEMLQSAFHFALNITLVRLLAPADYGVFAIILLLGGISLTYMRSLAGMPANLLIPAFRGRPRVIAHRVVFSSAALAFASLFGLVTALAIELWLQGDALAAGLFVGLWSLRSYVRSYLFAHEAPVTASLSDTVFSLAGTVFSAALVLGLGTVNLENVLFVLATANAVAIGAALRLHRQPLPISLRRSVRRRYLGMARQVAWATAGVTTSTVQSQGQVLLIAALAGPAAYAPIAAMFVIFAPLRLIASALANMVQPELAGLSALGEESAIARRTIFWTGMMLVASLGYAVVTVVAVPLLGPTIFVGQPRDLIALCAWGISVAPLLYLMPKVLLEVRRSFRLLTAISAVAAIAGICLVAILLTVLPPAWSMLGTLASEVVVLACCWAATFGPRRFGAAIPSKRSRAVLSSGGAEPADPGSSVRFAASDGEAGPDVRCAKA